MAKQDMQECIENCLQCYRACQETAMTYCLEQGGKHVEPTHFRLMINCAEICRTAADFMLSKSALYQQVCASCAEVCEACADSCDQLGDMENCARACRQCAGSCREMAGAYQLGRGQRAGTEVRPTM